MMKKFLIGIIVLTGSLMTGRAFAQDYQTTIGLRLGIGPGITFKHKFSEEHAIEAILYSRWRGTVIGALYEYHINLESSFNIYLGGGLHSGYYYGKYDHPVYGGYYQGNVSGLDLIFGLEYTFDEVPINLSLDWKPEFNFYGYNGLVADYGALSVRYVIK